MLVLSSRVLQAETGRRSILVGTGRVFHGWIRGLWRANPAFLSGLVQTCWGRMIWVFLNLFRLDPGRLMPCNCRCSIQPVLFCNPFTYVASIFIWSQSRSGHTEVTDQLDFFKDFYAVLNSNVVFFVNCLFWRKSLQWMLLIIKKWWYQLHTQSCDIHIMIRRFTLCAQVNDTQSY